MTDLPPIEGPTESIAVTQDDGRWACLLCGKPVQIVEVTGLGETPKFITNHQCDPADLEQHKPTCIACGQPTLAEDEAFGVKFVRCRLCNPESPV